MAEMESPDGASSALEWSIPTPRVRRGWDIMFETLTWFIRACFFFVEAIFFNQG
jgi:hypothetical protein